MRDKLIRHAPWLLALAALYGLGMRAWQAWAAHQVQWAHDLAFFTQILFNASEGRAWTSPLLLEPTGFFEMVHFHPIFAALLPIFMLRPEASTLLFFNVAAVCLAAVPLAGLARDRTGSTWFGLGAAVAWLVWLPAQTAALADFRPVVFFIPGFMLLLWGLARPCRWRLVFGALIVAGAREESGYLLPMLAVVVLVLPFGKRRRSDALILLGVGLAWLAFLLAFKGNFFFHFNPTTFFQGLGAAPPVPEALTHDRVRHLALLLAGGFGTVVLCPTMLLMLLPQVGFLMLDTHREWHAFTGTYPYLRHALLPFLAVGGVMGWAWVLDKLGRRHQRETQALIVVAMILASALAFHHQRQRLEEGLWQRNREAGSSVEVEAIDLLVARVPADARVLTDYRLIAALSGRRVLWATMQTYHEGEPPYGWKGPWPITLDWVDHLLVLRDDAVLEQLDASWELVSSGGDYGLWRRVVDPEDGYPEPIP